MDSLNLRAGTSCRACRCRQVTVGVCRQNFNGFIKFDRKYNRKKMNSVRFEPETPQLRTTRVSARLFESSHCIPNIYKLSSDGWMVHRGCTIRSGGWVNRHTAFLNKWNMQLTSCTLRAWTTTDCIGHLRHARRVRLWKSFLRFYHSELLYFAISPKLLKYSCIIASY